MGVVKGDSGNLDYRSYSGLLLRNLRYKLS